MMARPPKFEERSEEIMQAFEACVALKGLAATTLNDIAAEAGLPRSLVRYFMGNRDEMVDRLVERLVTRADRSLDRVRDAAGDMGVAGLLDAFFEEVFSNPLSNKVMGELWHQSASDPHVLERLRGVYRYAIDLLLDAMARDGVGGSQAERHDSAYAVLSLALGQTSLEDFGLHSQDRRATRNAAERIIASLRTGKANTP